MEFMIALEESWALAGLFEVMSGCGEPIKPAQLFQGGLATVSPTR